MCTSVLTCVREIHILRIRILQSARARVVGISAGKDNTKNDDMLHRGGNPPDGRMQRRPVSDFSQNINHVLRIVSSSVYRTARRPILPAGESESVVSFYILYVCCTQQVQFDASTTALSGESK